jgi:hypothetical protein
MDALQMRGELFSRLHSDVLKSRGFKKRGHWAIRDFGTHAQSFYLRASRFGRSDEAIFWIDLQIFSAAWLELVFPDRVYKGPAEGTPSLFLRELGGWMQPPQASHRIARATDMDSLCAEIGEAAEVHAFPFFDACTSLEQALEQLSRLPSEGSSHLAIAGLSRRACRQRTKT